MNGAQKTLSAAWLVVFGALGVQNHWLTQFTGWLGAPPLTGETAKSLVPGRNLNSWQAALIAYAILLVLAESDSAASLAVVISWGVAITELLITIPLIVSQYPQLASGGL